jgi:hypothetical protein
LKSVAAEVAAGNPDAVPRGVGRQNAGTSGGSSWSAMRSTWCL